MRLAVVATAALDQWALDFDGNAARTAASAEEARRQGARYRLGPELELTGYGCEDHFLEPDTEAHAWAALAGLIARGASDGLLLDVGLPATHAGARYNVRVLVADRKILLVRPKLALADDGNYRESRYFSAWRVERGLESFTLPPCVVAATADAAPTAPFGHAILQLADAALACESCEELFTPNPPHAALALAGVDVVGNGSGSHHQLRKLHTRLDLLRGATATGGIYLYANQRGCDGGRLYYDGCATIVVNGGLVAQGAQFGLADVEVVAATVDLDAVAAYRGARSSAQKQAAAGVGGAPPRVDARWFRLCVDDEDGALLAPTPSIHPRIHAVEEEIAYGPGAWLWDYLRRSGAGGFVLPLSGGADSAATAAIVASMCRLVETAVTNGDATVEADARRVARLAPDAPITARGLAGRLLTTVYMASTAASGAATRARAAALADQIGAAHLELAIDGAVKELLAAATGAVGCAAPRFKAHGGTTPESLALQNVQARTRMVLAFLLAQLAPWAAGDASYRLVLGSANVDEALRGYLTKYDCSSADINPIGSISKADLKSFLIWAADALTLPALTDIVAAPPTAELEPTVDGGPPPQTDEADMGMTYAELAQFGRLRTIARCGPVSMFDALARGAWRHLSPTAVAAKVKHFWVSHAANRHKATTLTPSYHAEAYSPDDNRFDHRPFLYRVGWNAQFREIDARVARMEGGKKGGRG